MVIRVNNYIFRIFNFQLFQRYVNAFIILKVFLRNRFKNHHLPNLARTDKVNLQKPVKLYKSSTSKIILKSIFNDFQRY
jgi:hypothetical protein